MMLAYPVVVNLTVVPSVENQYGKDTGACNPSTDSIEVDSFNPSINQTSICRRKNVLVRIILQLISPKGLMLELHPTSIFKLCLMKLNGNFEICIQEHCIP